jgi:hypothetical protein
MCFITATHCCLVVIIVRSCCSRSRMQRSIDESNSSTSITHSIGTTQLSTQHTLQLKTHTSKNTQLESATANSGAPQQTVDGLLNAARTVQDAINALLQAAEASEAKPTQNCTSFCFCFCFDSVSNIFVVLVSAFANKAKNVLAANAKLAASVGQPPEILKNTKSTVSIAWNLFVPSLTSMFLCVCGRLKLRESWLWQQKLLRKTTRMKRVASDCWRPLVVLPTPPNVWSTMPRRTLNVLTVKLLIAIECLYDIVT